MEAQEATEDRIFTPEGKTVASVRTVPVNAAIQPLLRHWLDINPEGCLLGDLKTGGEDSKRWAVIGKRVRYILRQNCKITDPRAVPYSIRKNFSVALETSVVPESTAQQIVGHIKTVADLRVVFGRSRSRGAGRSAEQDRLRRLRCELGPTGS